MAVSTNMSWDFILRWDWPLDIGLLLLRLLISSWNLRLTKLGAPDLTGDSYLDSSEELFRSSNTYLYHWSLIGLFWRYEVLLDIGDLLLAWDMGDLFPVTGFFLTAVNMVFLGDSLGCSTPMSFHLMLVQIAESICFKILSFLWWLAIQKGSTSGAWWQRLSALALRRRLIFLNFFRDRLARFILRRFISVLDSFSF